MPDVADERPWQRTRRGAALAVVAAATSLGAVSAFTQHARVCTPIASDTRAAAKTTCRPLSVTDPPVVGLAVLAAALFAPDVGELGLFGLVSWKRKVEETAAKQTELESKVADLHLTLAQVQSVNINLQSADEVRRLVQSASRGIDEKEREFYGRD